MIFQFQRTFFPVGQGAFYGETIRNEENNSTFNIVYDCGSVSKSAIKQTIKHSFPKGSKIDILFISHFDADHVNQITTLKDEFDIKRVVMPLLDKNDADILVGVYSILNQQDVVDIIKRPETFFGERTKITKVRAVNQNDTDNNPEENDRLSIKAEEDNGMTNLPPEISSGTPIVYQCSRKDVWLYIPYNYKFKERNKQFKELITQTNIDIDSIQNGKFTDEYMNKLKKLYKNKLDGVMEKLDGTINENSMLLISTPNPKETFFWHYLSPRYYLDYRYYFDDYLHCGGCIYTGDASLDKICDLFFNKVKSLNTISTIQVTHHGSKRSFDIDFFKKINIEDRLIICPISFGSCNQYGHPAPSVLTELLSIGTMPIFITENRNDIYIQFGRIFIS
ncbi:MBL fold metallo-hydrolase [Moraxella sp. ZY210820]|uniref:MBL fold metallo-hydrolase n=1 Tax=unclassified Moraxella TaxID=2685852 RepID=UPI0027314541|nr:MBL fold metallo-hydrolase [Moraxella sp. ZY210820]WLF84778.1 hypothetical protein LU301_04755 [Moraxella sp. ZY210820]